MKTADWPVPLGAAALVSGLLFAAMVPQACAGDPPPEPKSPIPTASSAPPPKPVEAPTSKVADSPTASNIVIDDAILKACGIAAPKAYFGFDSAHLLPAETAPLEAVARCFATGPLKGRSLKLVGHADPRGESEYNFVLGNSRAGAASEFMKSKGLPAAQVTVTSRGELDAVGTDEDSWARDRRVDMLLVQ